MTEDPDFRTMFPSLSSANQIYRQSIDDDAGSGTDDQSEDKSSQKAAKTDAVLLRAYRRQIMPPSLDAIEKRSWSSDEDVPEYVVEALQSVVDEGAVFDDFKSLPGRVADTITDTLTDALTEPSGWSLDSIVDRMSDALPRADPDDLEVVARTESAKVLNEAREEGYRDRGQDDSKFKWVGPQDSRTTDACEELKDRTNPDHGGTPVSLPELVDEERDVHDEYFDRLEFRKHVIHPNERHTFVRVPGTDVDTDIDVDVPDASEIDIDAADIEPQELSADTHGHGRDAYSRIAKQTTPTRRMREVEDALGGYIPVVLRQCLESSDGTKRGALRKLNGRLENADGYDHEEHGKVSPNTLYSWLDTYDTHIDHLV